MCPDGSRQPTAAQPSWHRCALHPDIANRVIVLDLAARSKSLLAEMSAEDIRDRLYTPLADLPAR
jgi:exonuclease I